MDDEQNRDRAEPDSAEPDEAGSLSEKVPEEVSGEGDTPLGTSGEHSDAPGPHGTGPLYEEGGARTPDEQEDGD